MIVLFEICLVIVIAGATCCHCFQVLRLKNCTDEETTIMKNLTNFKISGKLTKIIQGDRDACLWNCLNSKCRLATMGIDGTTCKQYEEPVFEITSLHNVSTVFLHDFCPENSDVLCLPRELMQFDDQKVEQNNGVTFNTSMSGHGLSIASSLSGYAVLKSYDSDNCILRPRLCPNGFTLAFYAKIYRSDKNYAAILGTRGWDSEGPIEGFLCFISHDRDLMCEIMNVETKRKTVNYRITLPTQWEHFTFTYRHSKDKILMYHNGTLVVNSHRNHGRAVRLNPVKKLVFSSTDVRTGGGNCNCEVDDVRIFEVALSPSEIRDLVDNG